MKYFTKFYNILPTYVNSLIIMSISWLKTMNKKMACKSRKWPINIHYCLWKYLEEGEKDKFVEAIRYEIAWRALAHALCSHVCVWVDCRRGERVLNNQLKPIRINKTKSNWNNSVGFEFRALKPKTN